ncbi:hypothetical protein BIY27_25835 [Gibbsiella quercinecans]|uniref:BapA/Bap/LapF family prefix-like domain-containing protein n=1 Tax=Gibbsiella quercinecans TaxID=929813 RepID=UPI000EF1F6D8|nr:hypothetical protein [Gibbsiella quercinecans]RLM02104.1 hypothetical protein BIY27_25835 [Gibbsiella quercinecans]
MINKLSIADAKGVIRETVVNSDHKVSLMNLDIAIIKVGKSDISHVSKSGPNIVLNFKDGTQLIFLGYFVKDNKIVVDDTSNNELYYITTDESGALIFNELTEIEALLQTSSDYHWVAIPAALAALAVPAIVFGTNRGGSHSNHKDKITDKDGNGVADTTDTLVADAQAAVNTAEEKQQAAAEAAAKADADGNGLITPAEAKAGEDANKALGDAKQAATA